MHDKGLIKAVNLRIRDWCASYKDTNASSRAMGLAKARFIAKFEEPDRSTSTQRRQDAWDRWIRFDEGLQSRGVLGPAWAKARLFVHEVLSDYRMGPLTFTNGSSFIPLGDHLSLACKLTTVWTITPDCFDLFAKYSYWHRALKLAVKKRFKRYCKKQGWNERAVNRKLWDRFKKHTEPAFQIYCFKLELIVTFVQGNRWSTVPKNNLKDRSICLEPLCNMLVQRAVGLGVRECLKDKLGIDLAYLADVHRRLISDENVATIDLSDCSDAISIRLVEYLLPKRVFKQILACRSDMTLGPDGDFYIVKKISSMGNGFTFDLMTLCLTALTRSFDASSSVFGDDIICQNSVAEEVVSNLLLAGFVINPDKTNIRSGYRESCGAHYVDGWGYVTAFDQRWNTNLHDVIVTCNKVAILSAIYGEPFDSLRDAIWTCIPSPWLGATVVRPTVYTGRPPEYDLDGFIRYGPVSFIGPSKKLLKSLRRVCSSLHKPGPISVGLGLEVRTLPAPDSLQSYQWDMYLMYIHNGRKTRKFKRLVSKSTLVARVGEEQIGFTKALFPERD